MDQLQNDLDANHPDLQIQIVGINSLGLEHGNPVAASGKDIPWLQDVDANDDGQSDVWTDWQVVWRDLFIVDSNSEVVEIINLTTNDLQFAGNYEAVKEILVEVAETAPPAPELVAGDCNGDNVVDEADLACVSDTMERDIVLDELGTMAGDLDGDGTVGFADFLVLSNNFGNEVASYTEGNVDLQGGVDFGDFLVLSNNFGSAAAADAALESW